MSLQVTVNLLASKVKWSTSIVGCSLNAAFMCFNQIDNKVNISTPASKDINTVMDVYIINNISTKILCYTRGQHIMCHDSMIILLLLLLYDDHKPGNSNTCPVLLHTHHMYAAGVQIATSTHYLTAWWNKG